MAIDAQTPVPRDYSQRIKNFRDAYGLTQAELAERIGVNFASVNRWENGQNRPRQMAWQRFLELESEFTTISADGPTSPVADRPFLHRELEFSANPKAVLAIAEAHRLRNGHMYSPKFATETSLVDPLPHQEIAVYEHMLRQDPLRFLLADDAGAGKTIMTGLYIKEMLTRRKLRRVLIVSPAGLIGNWEAELRDLLRLEFRVVDGSDAREDNPFRGAESDLVIVSIDTLAGDNLFGRLRQSDTEPYDLVVFDEAHKLSANRMPDFTVTKTRRYRLAETLAGANTDESGWKLSWSARHLLLLSATPHMGKDNPYYYIWRLLLPDILSTPEAFNAFPTEDRRRHFIRRVKEELIDFEGTLLYPERRSDTLIYPLSGGDDGERTLYVETTNYLQNYYNVSRRTNKSAVRLAMSVFQRRLASSTYALMRSFQRRKQKIAEVADRIRQGILTEEQFTHRQASLNSNVDVFEVQTADDDMAVGGIEQLENFEDKALEGISGLTLGELEEELREVDRLLDMSKKLYERGVDSKFRKLHEVLRDPRYADEKIIIFTEHHDTAEFIVRRLGALGYAGRVALIHGGMPYGERERQVNFFRGLPQEGGAHVLVATDAAGEGINLQWCWLMVNYDIPWNPARLEQRLGRIHRYGQNHDPVVAINLVADGTREGRVLRVLLEKLNVIRQQLQADKVFDVIGRLLEGISIKEHLEQMVIDDSVDVIEGTLDEALTTTRFLRLQSEDEELLGSSYSVRQHLNRLNEQLGTEEYCRLLPGHVRHFIHNSLSLLDLRTEGDFEDAFRLIPLRAGALDDLLPALDLYHESSRNKLTVYRPNRDDRMVWIRPGEPVFERIRMLVLERFGNDALQGAVFMDPYANQPYLFHLVSVEIEQHLNGEVRQIDSSLVGIKQYVDGTIEECSVEHLLLLRELPGYPPSRERIAMSSRVLARDADEYVRQRVAVNLAQAHRDTIKGGMDDRLRSVSLGFDYLEAELLATRSRLTRQLRAGNTDVTSDLSLVKKAQRTVAKDRDVKLSEIRTEADGIRVGETKTVAHALVVRARSSVERDQYDARVEEVAVQIATEYEISLDAEVKDVSVPKLARQAGLTDWPGFDLLSKRPANDGNSIQELAIEVKGRSGKGSVEIRENEWIQACNRRDRYWLYVVLDCATENPQLFRIRDPFGKLLARRRESTAFTVTQGDILAVAE